MHWLILACLFDFGFGQLFKHAQRRGHDAAVVVCANYLMVAALLGLFLGLTGKLLMTVDAVKVGVLTGCACILSMSIMTGALKRANVGAVLTAFRMAIIVPVIASVAMWQETVDSVQVFGILLALPALAMMTRGTSGSHRTRRAVVLGIVALVFCAQGTTNTCLRWVHYAHLDDQMAPVLLVVGLTAGSLGALVVIMKRKRLRRAALLTGAGIGLYNLIALVVILTVLSRFSGTIVFPVMGCTVVVLDGLSAHFYWKEPLSRLAWWGLGLAVLAVLIVVT